MTTPIDDLTAEEALAEATRFFTARGMRVHSITLDNEDDWLGPAVFVLQSLDGSARFEHYTRVLQVIMDGRYFQPTKVA